MSSAVDRSRVGYAVDVGEIHGLSEQGFQKPVSRATLRPEEEVLSLGLVPDAPQHPVAPLARYLGPALTVANPAWTGDPVPRMRELQKVLVEHSLSLAEDDRSECLAAISIVEKAVQLRLRLQQMRMTEAEMDIKPDGEKENEKANSARNNTA